MLLVILYIVIIIKLLLTHFSFLFIKVLCGCDVTWMPATNGEVPSGALPSGESEDGEILYVGRAQHDGVTSVGKVLHKINSSIIMLDLLFKSQWYLLYSDYLRGQRKFIISVLKLII